MLLDFLSEVSLCLRRPLKHLPRPRYLTCFARPITQTHLLPSCSPAYDPTLPSLPPYLLLLPLPPRPNYIRIQTHVHADAHILTNTPTTKTPSFSNSPNNTKTLKPKLTKHQSEPLLPRLDVSSPRVYQTRRVSSRSVRWRRASIDQILASLVVGSVGLAEVGGSMGSMSMESVAEVVGPPPALGPGE